MERENLLEHVRRTGPYFEEKMFGLGDLPLVGDARGRSFMFALEFVSDKDTRELFSPEVQIATRVTDAARRRGLVARGIGEMVLISPPLILTTEQIDFIAGTLRTSIEESSKRSGPGRSLERVIMNSRGQSKKFVRIFTLTPCISCPDPTLIR